MANLIASGGIVMSRVVVTAVLSVVVAFVAGNVVERSARAQNAPTALVIGDEHELDSKILGETRRLIVGKPPSYMATDDPYPIVVLLDGPDHFHHTTATANFLARNGRMPEVLVVAVANTDRTRDLTPRSQVAAEMESAPTHGGADNFLRFVDEELLPWVEQNYRAGPYRILIGHSFGGLFAINTLVTRPDVFDAYIAISPSLQWNDQRLVQQAETFFEATDELAASLYMTVGNEGGNLLGGARKLSGILDAEAPRGFSWHFNLMPEETHGSVPLRSTYQGFESVFSDWYLHDPLAMFDVGGIAAIERFYEKGSKKFGLDRPMPVTLPLNLSYELIAANRIQEATALIADYSESYPLGSQILVALAEAYAASGDTDQAREHYARALRNNPGDEKAKSALKELGGNVSIPVVNVRPKVLSSYVGTYELPSLNTSMTVSLQDGQLVRIVPGRDPQALIPLSETRFYRKDDDVQYTFRVKEGGTVDGVTMHLYGEPIEGKKIQ
jgi:predicted alpha/beta superfamily hydrolase